MKSKSIYNINKWKSFGYINLSILYFAFSSVFFYQDSLSEMVQSG